MRLEYSSLERKIIVVLVILLLFTIAYTDLVIAGKIVFFEDGTFIFFKWDGCLPIGSCGVDIQEPDNRTWITVQEENPNPSLIFM